MYRITLSLLVITCSLSSVFGQIPFDPTSPTQPANRKYNPVTGVLGAFPEEIKLLLAQVQQKKERIIQHTLFTEGILRGRHVVVAQTGIGKVNAATTTTLLIEHFQPQQIIFTGIAGGINPDLFPGDLVIGTKIAHHDYGTLTPDSMLRRPTRDPFTMQENPLYFPCDTNLVRLSRHAGKDLGLEKLKTSAGLRSPQIISGVIVTGDVFVSSEKATQQLRTQMNAEATEMEGAAVAQVCWQQQQPFIVIRSISDSASSSANDDIRNFYRIAAYNSASLVMAIVKSLGQRK